jgi:hypothetical protein
MLTHKETNIEQEKIANKKLKKILDPIINDPKAIHRIVTQDEAIKAKKHK